MNLQNSAGFLRNMKFAKNILDSDLVCWIHLILKNSHTYNDIICILETDLVYEFTTST